MTNNRSTAMFLINFKQIMEAPKKLYISDYGSEIRYNWHPERLAVKDIEYTRTDVLIDKALEWIRKEIRPYYSEVKYKYEDFKKYMKG